MIPAEFGVGSRAGVVAGSSTRWLLLFFSHWGWGEVATGLTRGELEVADTSEKEVQGDKPPGAAPQVSPSRVTVTVVSLAALAVIGAATANSLPSLDRFSLPALDRSALPSFDFSSLPSLDRVTFPDFDLALPKLDFSWPNLTRSPPPAPSRVAAQPPPPVVSVPIPDSVVRAMLRDVQTSQQQHTDALATLTQHSESQQADLRRISRQLHALATQVNVLQGAVGPLTTSSIPQANARIRHVRKSHKPVPDPAIPKPVGPVSVGGAPLAPVPASGSGV